MPLPYAFLASADNPEPPPPPGGCVVIATGGGSGGCGAVVIDTVSAAVGDVGAEVVGWVRSVGAAVTTACAFAFAFAFAFSL
jgi:hypothetical protein